MTMTRKRGLMLGAVLLAGGVAMAQKPGASRDPATMPEFQGKVLQYELTPRGDVDGVILADGTEVHLPPHLGAQLVAAVKPGDDVTIRGEKNGTTIRAGSIKAGEDGPAVVDRGPPAGRPGAGPQAGPRPAGAAMEASGVAKMALHGPRGELNGVLLEDGTAIHLPLKEAGRLADSLKPGQPVAVRGEGVSGPTDRSIAARAFGPSMDKLTQLAAPPPPGGPKPTPKG